MPALLLGSISTVADTSERQRQAFNESFRAHGLNWQWDREDYRAMLGKSGGRNRIADYAQSRGEDVDAAAVHQTKSRLFQENLAAGGLAARPGVADAIAAAKDSGWKVGLVTTTSRDNITALLAALAPGVTEQDFDVIVDAGSVSAPKPDKAAYAFALEALGEQPGDCVAIEDNPEGAQAAAAAGIECVAFPNENTAGQDFGAASRQVSQLDPAELISAG